ncbi:hypothetical protein MNBD_GAMMA03-134 [hydrothermal vent metagenome]|uniref:Uncharacterized protein n=1 Tax=hydrothermal vent metagenome TaxID=652676 RepID=A0A3B0W1I8_9ZZZZ
MLFEGEIYLIKEDGNESPMLTSEVASIIEEPTPKPLQLAYKGGNAKRIALIISNDADEFLNASDETLLLNILKAIGLSLEDVAIINHHSIGTDWQEQIDFSKAIVFGILPSTYGLTTDNYIIQHHKEAKWLFSDSLFALANDKVLKGKLWVEIQKLFA